MVCDTTTIDVFLTNLPQHFIKAQTDSIFEAWIINQVRKHFRTASQISSLIFRITGGGTGVESDPIANLTACERDIPYFTKLGINTIRVYAVDNSKNHDTCMNALAAAGIYLVLDTDTSKYSLNREDPSESYNSVYLQSVFATIDAFANYSNTLAFLSGNEVINSAANTNCAPYVKAVTRDMKQYIGSRGYRSIPVGYSAADVAENQELMADYMNCGTTDQRSDFYAINDYSWCDPSSFTTSGWDTLVKNYTGYGIPLL
jgi:1,3-beta-glucanosyltransferase GAS5